MSLITQGRVKWHECVVELLGQSDAIADRDEDGRAVYYLFGWSGTVQYIDPRGHLTEVEASLGSVRMDGFALFTKADLGTDRIVVAEIETPRNGSHRIYASIGNSERAARQGRSFDCTITDKPELITDAAIRVAIMQVSD